MGEKSAAVSALRHSSCHDGISNVEPRVVGAERNRSVANECSEEQLTVTVGEFNFLAQSQKALHNHLALKRVFKQVLMCQVELRRQSKRPSPYCDRDREKNQ